MPLIRKDAQPSQAFQQPDARKALASGMPDERWAAARGLGKDAEGALPLIDALRTEQDPRVREAIFTSLAHLRTGQAVEGILPYLRSSDAAIRTGALDALNAMPEAVMPYIAGLLNDADADIRLLVCEIARRLPEREAIPLLSDLLDREGSANVCGAAVDVLAEMGDAEALPALARCAARFQENTFLVFAIGLAITRIGEGGLRGTAKSP